MDDVVEQQTDQTQEILKALSDIRTDIEEKLQPLEAEMESSAGKIDELLRSIDEIESDVVGQVDKAVDDFEEETALSTDEEDSKIVEEADTT